MGQREARMVDADLDQQKATTVEQLLAAARAEGVDVAIFHSLRNGPDWDNLPEPLRAGLSRAAKRAIAHEIADRLQLAKALDALAAEGIDCLLLKGTALAHWLYPAPHWRPRCDTDLLFADRTAVERAYRVLHGLGYRKGTGIAGRYISHQFACTRRAPKERPLTLDMHWQVSNSNFIAQRFRFADLWVECRPVPILGPRAVALSARHALIHALFHRSLHLGSTDPDRLIWLYDMHLLCARFSTEDWDQFVDEVVRRGLQPLCRDGLQDLSELLGTPIPPSVDAALAAPPSASMFDQLDLKHPGLRRRLFELLSLPSWGQRLGLIREHLLPDAEYMREGFGADRWWKLPFAYLRRILRGLTRRLRW